MYKEANKGQSLINRLATINITASASSFIQRSPNLTVVRDTVLIKFSVSLFLQLLAQRATYVALQIQPSHAVSVMYFEGKFMSIPNISMLNEYSKDSYFCDSFSKRIKYNNQTSIEVFLEIATQTPAWIKFLMSMRNWIVSKIGLKNLGALQDVPRGKLATKYVVGERVGIFTLVSLTEHEVVLEDCDKHLNVRVSFLVEPEEEAAIVHLNTVVHVNNVFGKIYMFFVTPFHKIIVPSMLKGLEQA